MIKTKARRSARRLLGVVASVSLVTAGAASMTPPAAADGPYDPFFAQPVTAADLGAAARPFGVAAGDYDGDGKADMVVGRTTGNVAFVKGNGDGTFAAPVAYAWKAAFFNAWAFAPGDVNGDGKLDVVWGASAASSGCSVSPVPSTGCPATVTVNDGDVRAWLGNGDGTFQETPYFVTGVRHNAGTLLADIGTDAGSVSATDIDGDGDTDVVAGAVEGVKLLTNGGTGTFTPATLGTSGTYFPATSTQNSPWGLAFGDADGDGDQDLWVGDRALYVYLYKNDGAGAFTLTPGNIPQLGADRANVYLRHDPTYRAAVGFTPSLASADVNGDGKADLFVGLHSGGQTPTNCGSTSNPLPPCPHDGEVILDISKDGTHSTFGSLADLGSAARGLQAADFNADGATDVAAGVYEGQVKLLRQLPPLDSDGDGVSDYVDNAPDHANAPRMDMTGDGVRNAADQLDNDGDTVAGNPEDSSTWQRLGDPADADDDNDGVVDVDDNCAFGANAGQADKDSDGKGDACDPLFDSDADGDGVNTFDPNDPLYAAAKAAAVKWSTQDTKFVVRIDALGRFFQNEFTQLMTDAGVLTPEEWATKCWENYAPGDVVGDSTYEPCGADPTQPATLPGGKDVPISLVTIPKHLWTDAPVIDWINDRNANPNLEIAQHGTFHDGLAPQGDWVGATDGREVFSCETCGLTEAESYEKLKLGYDILTGNYDTAQARAHGATATSPKVDWSDAAHPMISYAAPYNTSDETARKAMAQYGIRTFTASIAEELPTDYYGKFFASAGTTLDNTEHEKFDRYGVFHASADNQIDPIETPDGSYDAADKAALLADLEANTEVGGLNTWLIEEVEWGGRTDNESPRSTEGTINREDNTVSAARWQQWLDLLDFVKANGVVMTLDEVALAKAFDNAPTVANADQADADHDGIGDAVDGATLTAPAAQLSRNVDDTLSATLASADGTPLAGQVVTFSYDADGDEAAESYPATTGPDGVATAHVTTTRPVGSTSYDVAWTDGQDAAASQTGTVTVVDASTLTLGSLPATGQLTDQVTVDATLVDSDQAPLEGETVTFTVGSVSASGTTDLAGRATATVTLAGPVGAQAVSASFAGSSDYGDSGDTDTISVVKEATVLAATVVPGRSASDKTLVATLTEDDGPAVGAKTIVFTIQQRVRGKATTVQVGSAVTDGAGVARWTIPSKYVGKTAQTITATFAGDASYVGSSKDVSVSR